MDGKAQYTVKFDSAFYKSFGIQPNQEVPISVKELFGIACVVKFAPSNSGVVIHSDNMVSIF